MYWAPLLPLFCPERELTRGLLWGLTIAAFLIGDHGSEIQQWPVLLWSQAELSVLARTSVEVLRKGRIGPE